MAGPARPAPTAICLCLRGMGRKVTADERRRNPEETERVSLDTLEKNNRNGIANVRAITEKGRTLTPEEIVAVLNSLNDLDHRHYSTYASTAARLVGSRAPELVAALGPGAAGHTSKHHFI